MKYATVLMSDYHAEHGRASRPKHAKNLLDADGALSSR